MNLITGGSGFLGLNLAKKLAAKNEKVRIFDLRIPGIKNKRIEFFKGDIINFDDVYNACDNVDIVFNLASLLPCSRAGQMFKKVNVGGTENLLKASLKRKVKKVIHVSSSIVYGVPERIPCDETCRTRPLGAYGKSKLDAEKLCLDYIRKGLKITILRPRLIIGPGRLGLLTILFEWVRRGKRIYLIGSGKNHFQMVSVYDLIDACLLSAKRGSNEIINIGVDNVPTVYELMKALIKHAKSNSKMTPVNATFARYVLRLLDFFRLTPLNAEHYFIADKEYVLDTKKAKKILGWKPKYSQIEAMNSAYDWYMANYKGFSKKEHLPSDFPEERLLKLLRFFS